ncbi:hypothetical protein ABIB48_001366 [Arthrobacter sp. UYCu511]|uniref:HNH endonuclease signature motif containing protein n=1 Tax=Arthrobacter sp. UYCu511 TaxID=3156337 RepID=UPI003398D224
MSIREDFPGDRGAEATQDVASTLAAITLPSIEPFGSDSPELYGLQGRPEYPVPFPLPITQLSVAQCVYNSGMEALSLIKRLEDAVAGCKARLVARISGASAVEAQLLKLDRWQNGVAASSAATEMALTLGIPEPTAAALEHHSTVLVQEHPEVLEALEAGILSWRHATIINEEILTLQETASTTAEDKAMLEARLLVLSENTTAASFLGKARRAREKMHPETITTRTKEAFAKRNIKCDAGKDGMSWLTLHLPTISASAIYTRCTSLARTIKSDAAAAQRVADQATAGNTGTNQTGTTQPGTGQDCREYRTLEQLRADVATLLLLGQELPSNNTTTNTATVGAAGTAGTPGAPGTAGTPGTADTAGAPDTRRANTGSSQEPSTAGSHGVGTTATQEPNTQKTGTSGPLATYREHEAVYLQQLHDLAQSRSLVDPPLPEALVLVTVPFLGLLGLTDEPAELAGREGGPIPEEIARKLLKNASTFLRVLTDPITGAPLPLEPQRYTLRAAEKAVLQALAGGCYIPNCPNPVMDTELDHLRAFEFGGASTLANVRPACKRHHIMKHLKDDKDRHGRRRSINEPERNGLKVRGWTPKVNPDGRIGWTMPSGTYQPPLNNDPPAPHYPTWLKKIIAHSLTRSRTPRSNDA